MTDDPPPWAVGRCERCTRWVRKRDTSNEWTHMSIFVYGNNRGPCGGRIEPVPTRGG